MKKFFLILSFFSLAFYASAQTTEEWLRQKETAVKYLTEQILALRGYAKVLGEGYDVVQKGLRLIHDVKGADFRQHQAYFDALLQVTPTLHHYSNTKKCFALQAYLEKTGMALMSEIESTSALQAGEKAYIRQMVKAVHNNSQVVIGALKTTLENEAYAMQDKERLVRINEIYKDLQHKKALLLSLTQQTMSLIGERTREAASINRVKKINAKN